MLKNKHVCRNTPLNGDKFLPTFYIVIFNKFLQMQAKFEANFLGLNKTFKPIKKILSF